MLNQPPRPNADIFEIQGDNARRHVWHGDRFVVEPDEPTVTLCRTLTREEFDALVADNPEALRLIRPRVSSSRRAALKVV